MFDSRENEEDESADCPIIPHIHTVRIYILFPLYIYCSLYIYIVPSIYACSTPGRTKKMNLQIVL